MESFWEVEWEVKTNKSFILLKSNSELLDSDCLEVGMNKLSEMEKNEQEGNNEDYDEEEEDGDILSGSCCLYHNLRIRFL